MRLPTSTGSLDIKTLRAHYTAGTLTPEQVIAAVYERLDKQDDDHVWITLVPREQTLARAKHLAASLHLPFAGIPFAVKDNMDVIGYATTVGGPDFAYVPETTASVVERLEQAGAVLIGKTNLDQFATGLVGSPPPGNARYPCQR